MRALVKKAVRFLTAEDGPTAVEYAMMLLLVFLGCMTAVSLFGQGTASSLQNSSNVIQDAIGPTP